MLAGVREERGLAPAAQSRVSEGSVDPGEGAEPWMWPPANPAGGHAVPCVRFRLQQGSVSSASRGAEALTTGLGMRQLPKGQAGSQFGLVPGLGARLLLPAASADPGRFGPGRCS